MRKEILSSCDLFPILDIYMSGAEVNWIYSLNTFVSKGHQPRLMDLAAIHTNHVSLLNLDFLCLTFFQLA